MSAAAKNIRERSSVNTASAVPTIYRPSERPVVTPELLPPGNGTARLNGNRHVSEIQVKELFVSSRELYPFDATGGIVLRLVFVGGPDLRFFLCELGNQTFLDLVSVCTQMFGVPILADPGKRRQ